MMRVQSWLKAASAVLALGLISTLPARSRELPSDPSFWQQLDTLPPTPKGAGYLPGVESGTFVQFRYPVPAVRPARYLINIDNIVAMNGGGSSYQVEIHLDAPAGPLLYKGSRITVGHRFNAEDLSRLDATELLTAVHLQQGYVDVWATAWVEGDTWTTYRDAADTRWDMFAQLPTPDAYARWRAKWEQREQMLTRGIRIIPQPQRIELLDADFALRPGLSIVLLGSTSGRDRATAETVCRELNRIGGGQIATVGSGTDHQVRLVLAPDSASLRQSVGFEVTDEVGAQGYVLDVSRDVVLAAAQSTAGLYYAAQTLLQLAGRTAGGGVIRGVRIVDWPDLKYRMAQYDIARGNTVNVEYWKRWIRELSRLKINQIMLYMEDDWQSEKYPFLGRPDTFDRQKADELVAYAEDHHVELVPQVESLGHAGALLRHEQLKDLRTAGRALCPHAQGTLPFLDELYAEICEAFPQSKLFHVGADEVWGFEADPRCAGMVKERGEEGVYAFHLNNLQRLLGQRNRKLAFWGDEVLNHPKVADMLTRDCVVFDWHYGNQRAYPSIKSFQDRGFSEIYVCPAVHGYFDVYPTYRMAFGNISGFIRAGVAHGVDGVCCTTWGMNRGGNAENYLYGLAYAAECAWSAQEIEREFFDDRFAAVWLGVAPTAEGLHDDIDRAFWFSWRGEERAPFWQQLFRVSRLFFGPYRELLDKLDAEAQHEFRRQAEVLDGLCSEALDTVGRLRQAATRNLATLSSLAHAIRVHQYVARKILVMCRFSTDYRTAYLRDPRNPEQLRAIVTTARSGLASLRELVPGLEAGIREYVEQRGGDPNDLVMCSRARADLDAYRADIATARAALDEQGKIPTPTELGLGHRLLVRIGGWTTGDVNPSDKEQPRKLVFEVTDALKSAGAYQVEWDYTRGQDGLDIVATGLYRSSSQEKVPDAMTPVTVDEHHAFTGAGDRDNRYTLELEQIEPGVRLFIIGTVYNQREFDTTGDVWLRQDW